MGGGVSVNYWTPPALGYYYSKNTFIHISQKCLNSSGLISFHTMAAWWQGVRDLTPPFSRHYEHTCCVLTLAPNRHPCQPGHTRVDDFVRIECDRNVATLVQSLVEGFGLRGGQIPWGEYILYTYIRVICYLVMCVSLHYIYPSMF